MSELTVAGQRVVREIALRGSFTAAARLLGYSQPGDCRIRRHQVLGRLVHEPAAA
jgi:hypothetical protein